ncbi:MAG: hypothetical protein K9I48_01150 [Sphingobacteriales bacterium]|nr:hypothetical protein [Sphingobacteriales bacterium]
MKFKTLLLILFASASFAQKVDFATPEKSFQRTFMKVIGQNENGFFVLKSTTAFSNKQDQLRLRDNKVDITYINNNLATIWTYSLNVYSSDYEIQDISFLNDSLYLYYAIINKEANKNELFAQKFNLKKGIPDTSPVLLDEIQFDKKRNRGTFYIRQSKNKKMLATMYKQSESENDKLSISVKVLDSSLQTIWSNKYKTEFYDGVLFLNDFKLCNDSNVYILTSLDLDKKMLRDKKYTLNVAKTSSSKLIPISISLEKYFINDIKMEFDYINNQIVMAGFYSELNSFSSAGIVYANINLNNLVAKPRIYTESFKAKFLNEFNSERTINRGTELINYYIDKILVRTDGGVILVSESNYVTESTNYNSYYQLYTTSYTYHYDNIILFSINPTGRIHWESIVRKNQVSEDDAGFYSSYIINLDVDKVNVIYNKFIRKATDILSCSINNKGEATEKVLLKENESTLIMPAGGKQISADQLVIPCIQKNKTNFIRITF